MRHYGGGAVRKHAIRSIATGRAYGTTLPRPKRTARKPKISKTSAAAAKLHANGNVCAGAGLDGPAGGGAGVGSTDGADGFGGLATAAARSSACRGSPRRVVWERGG